MSHWENVIPTAFDSARFFKYSSYKLADKQLWRRVVCSNRLSYTLLRSAAGLEPATVRSM